MALPLAGALASLLASQAAKARRLAWIFPAAGATLALATAWLMRGLPFETTIGLWAPVSMTGSPLILAGSLPGASIIIFAAAAQWAASLHPDERELRPHHTLAALTFSALVMTAFAGSFVTLLVGIGLVDLLSLLTGLLRGRNAHQVITDGLFRGASLALFTVAVVLYAAADGSLYLPLAALPDRFMGFITVGLALRLGLAPLRATAGHFHDSHWTTQAGSIASLIVLEKLIAAGAPEHRAWFFALALLTVLFAVALGGISSRRANLLSDVDAGLLCLAATSAVIGQPGVVAVSAGGWLLATTLLGQPSIAATALVRRVRSVGLAAGALCAIGAPATAGFIGRSGVVDTWAGRGLGGAVLIAGFTAALALLVFGSLRLIRLRGGGQPVEQPPIYNILGATAGGLLIAHVFAFGVFPELAGAPSLPDALARNGALGWIAWLTALAAGAAALWLEPLWIGAFDPHRQRLCDVLGLGWLHAILDGAMLRIGTPLSRLFTVLESRSALLWTIVFLLIFVLVSRPGGP